MLKAKKIMVEDYMKSVVCVEECKWNEMASSWQVLEMVCEGFNLPVKVIVECLDVYLMAQEDGEIFEFPREVKTVPMETMYSFGLSDGGYSVGTGTEIENMLLEDKDASLCSKTIASYDDCEWLVLICSIEIPDGTYLLSDGLLEVENGELEHIVLKEVI